MSCKLVYINGGTFYKQSILIPKDAQIKIEALHSERRRKLNTTFQQTINFVLDDYFRLLKLVKDKE